MAYCNPFAPLGSSESDDEDDSVASRTTSPALTRNHSPRPGHSAGGYTPVSNVTALSYSEVGGGVASLDTVLDGSRAEACGQVIVRGGRGGRGGGKRGRGRAGGRVEGRGRARPATRGGGRGYGRGREVLVERGYAAQGSVGEQTGPYTIEQTKGYNGNGQNAYDRKIGHEEHGEFVEAYRYAAGGQFAELADKKAAAESKLAPDKVGIRWCVNGPSAKHSNKLGAMPTASDSRSKSSRPRRKPGTRLALGEGLRDLIRKMVRGRNWFPDHGSSYDINVCPREGDVKVIPTLDTDFTTGKPSLATAAQEEWARGDTLVSLAANPPRFLQECITHHLAKCPDQKFAELVETDKTPRESDEWCLARDSFTWLIALFERDFDKQCPPNENWRFAHVDLTLKHLGDGFGTTIALEDAYRAVAWFLIMTHVSYTTIMDRTHQRGKTPTWKESKRHNQRDLRFGRKVLEAVSVSPPASEGRGWPSVVDVAASKNILSFVSRISEAFEQGGSSPDPSLPVPGSEHFPPLK